MLFKGSQCTPKTLRLLRMNAPNGVETCFAVILRINLAKRFTAAKMKLANHWVNLDPATVTYEKVARGILGSFLKKTNTFICYEVRFIQ